MDRPAAITTSGLGKRYGSVVALAGLDLDVPAGGITALVGPAGAGKSTVIRLLGGLARPTAGSGTVAGVPIRLGSRELHQRVGLLPEGDALDEWMSARELLSFAAELAGVPRLDIPDRVVAALDRAGMDDAAATRIGTLSRAQRRRLGLAQARIGEPEIVLLDEPLAGLDPASRADLTEHIRELAPSATVILSSADPGHVETLCERVVVLAGGKVVVDARVDELIGGRTGSAYLVELEREPGLAAAGVVARLRSEPWVRELEVTGRSFRITVGDDARAARELLPSIVAAGLPIAAFRRERPTLAEAIAVATAEHTATPSRGLA